jgi:acetyltransferase-like isoleucine patch superfamily enzyme
MFDPETTLGDQDIYRIEFYSDLNPRPVTIEGTVTFKGKQPGEHPAAQVQLRNDKGQIIAQMPLAEDGKFQFTGKLKGNYDVVVKADNYQKVSSSFEIPPDYSVGQMNVKVCLQPAVTEKITLPVIFFGFDKYTIPSKERTKIDNLIQIGHNVEVGERTVMAAQTGIAGSTKIGKDCMFGGQVGIAGHIKIADGVKIAAKSGIHNSIRQENAILEGIPVMPIRDFQRSIVYFKRLPELVKRIDELEKKIKELTK